MNNKFIITILSISTIVLLILLMIPRKENYYIESSDIEGGYQSGTGVFKLPWSL